ncbi:EAL domain-containing protein [Tissierella creatinophila]|uniref:Putative membrane protein YjcC n=1 Tax=Tissierella creatinophila DSM 6911 TaxID=1123403 RepID=A0A1U7M2S2_TISCR|nr:EAL domain-containing protein [Tissierella creatinophila]OLS01622.1 putative membrane protein YjcC [Tissierella creatinophila DSM 6911]
MNCNRCRKLHKTFFENQDVYMNLPTHHHIELSEIALKKNNYNFRAVDDGYLIKQVEFQDFILFLSNSVFNPVEQKDIKILPLQNGEDLKFSSLRNYRSLLQWVKLYQGMEVAEIINEGRIKTLFQPIIDPRTGEIHGYEALSRGVLKDGTIMNPEKLFSIAKEMDLLFYLDRVCREYSIRAASRKGIIKKIFVNFIPTAIYEPSLCLKSTAKVLNEENINEDQIVFEVVETEKVEDFNHLNGILNYYRDKGYSTALDDIGSGYSTIDSLLQLRPNYMKIDMNIIRDIDINSNKQEILSNFINAGKKIGATILAEGVETLAEYEYLKRENVDLMQGYLFGKPEETPLTGILLP